MALHEKTR